MRIYVDESFKNDSLSIGIYVSRGFDGPLRDYIVRLYDEVWRLYNVGRYRGEAKFHRFIYGLGRHNISLSAEFLRHLLDRVIDYMRDNGFMLRLVIRDTRTASVLEPYLYDFLARLRIKRQTIEKFLCIWILARQFRVREIVFDCGFQISKDGLDRIFSALGLSIKTFFKDSGETPGLQIADFTAGVSPHIAKQNVHVYWRGNCRVYHTIAP